MLREQQDQIGAVASGAEWSRAVLGLDKNEFAEPAGLTEQAHGAVAKGRRPLWLYLTKRLRKTYGLPLDFLYFGEAESLPERFSRKL